MTTTPTTDANSTQVGGNHYKSDPIEHWDIVALLKLDYFQGQITKYVIRWKKKKGVEDLKKAAHFLQKYIELQEREGGDARLLSDAVHKLEDDRRFGQPHYGHDEKADAAEISDMINRDVERYQWLRQQALDIFDSDGLRYRQLSGGGVYLDNMIDKVLQEDQRNAIRTQEGS